MRTNLQKRNEGFTIIEVMIVLAIAGLIMLIVFLAVPALQRNSRNTQRKNDVANYAAAINEWSQSNRGTLPTAQFADVNALAELGFYTEPTTAWAAAPAGGLPNTVTVDQFQVATAAKCGTIPAAGTDPAVAASAISGPARSFVILYAVENSAGDPVRQCQES